jgi:hypothetical protein
MRNLPGTGPVTVIVEAAGSGFDDGFVEQR